MTIMLPNGLVRMPVPVSDLAVWMQPEVAAVAEVEPDGWVTVHAYISVLSPTNVCWC